MYSSIKSVIFAGMQVDEIDVQTHISPGGLPAFAIVGLGNKAVSEAKDRIRAAFQALGIGFPSKKVTINLAPSDLYKSGSHLDLPIALGIMISLAIIPQEELLSYIALGELALDSSLQKTNGTLIAGIYANSKNFGLICPYINADEAVVSGNIDILPAKNLSEILNHFRNERHIEVPALSSISECKKDIREEGAQCKEEEMEDVGEESSNRFIEPSRSIARYNSNNTRETDGQKIQQKKNTTEISSESFDDVYGQEHVKRALEIAAAGGHHILISGYPGSGKSMLARRFRSILPELTSEEKLDILAINSVRGQGITTMDIQRPFRDPHSSASLAAVIGGGRDASPGEVTLAHHGVLLLDEIAEFSPNVIDALRQPLETRDVSIARANAHVTYPARFQLIGTMNPCKCGYFQHRDERNFCRKSPLCAMQYQRKLSGPFLDRFDIRVDTETCFRNKNAELLHFRVPFDMSASAIVNRIMVARQAQCVRYVKMQDIGDIRLNCDLSGAHIFHYLNLDQNLDRSEIHSIITDIDQAISLRGYDKILRLARTIADLNASENVTVDDIREAAAYRKTQLIVV